MRGLKVTLALALSLTAIIRCFAAEDPLTRMRAVVIIPRSPTRTTRLRPNRRDPGDDDRGCSRTAPARTCGLPDRTKPEGRHRPGAARHLAGRRAPACRP